MALGFPDGTLVRLRNRARGTYLHGEDDRLRISLSPRGDSPGSAWEVRRVLRGGVAYFVFRAASTGRYLALSPHNLGGRRVAQRGYDAPGHPSVMWLAINVWAPGGRRFVLLRHVFGFALRADGRRTGVSAEDPHIPCWMMHWAVEVSTLRAAPPPLPPPATASDHRRLVEVHVPRLTPDCITVSRVTLPVVDGRGAFVGSIRGQMAMGLSEVAQGRGQELWVPARLLQEQLGRRHLPPELAALASVPSRSRGRATRALRYLRLHVVNEDAEDGDDADQGEGGAEGHAAEDQQGVHEAVAAELHPGNADQPGAAGVDQDAPLDAAGIDGGVAHDAAGAELDAPLDGEEVEGGALAQGGVANDDAPAADYEAEADLMLSYLDEAYTIMRKRFRDVERLVAEKRAAAEAAAARGDWAGVAGGQRVRQQLIEKAIQAFNDNSAEAARLRDWLVKHSVPPPSPPAGARVHPNSLLPGRRG